MLPKVSISLVTYNHGEFLRDCIDSILSQNYPNLEIVVADDGSNDASQDLIRTYAAAHPDIIKPMLADHNQGSNENANKAVRNCTGKYIAYIDGDDLMLPGKILAQVEYLEAHPDCVLCYHDLDVFDSANGQTLRRFNSGPGAQIPREGDVRVLISHGTFFGACSAMYRSSAMPARGYDTRLRSASDWLYWIEVAAVGGQVRYLACVLGRYRRHTNNKTSFNKDWVDQFLTLAIVDALYPRWAAFVRRGRSRLWYARGVDKVQAGMRAEGRALLWQSFLEYPGSWKWVAWWSKSWLPIPKAHEPGNPT